MNTLTHAEISDLHARLTQAFVDAICAILSAGGDPEPLRKCMAGFVAGTNEGEAV